MSRRLTDNEVSQYLDETTLALVALRAAMPRLHRRARYSARDGYSSAGMGSRRGLGIADPTAHAANAAPVFDPVRSDVERLDQFVTEIAERAGQARNILRRLDEKVEVERDRQNSIPNCVNPACGRSLHDQGPNGHGIAGRCDVCYEFRRVNQRDRGPELVGRERERSEHRRVS